jgi:hypothetical protein
MIIDAPDKTTVRLVEAAVRYAPAQLDKLIEQENMLAFGRHTNRFSSKLTPDQEYYLAYSSLPYTTEPSSVRLIDLWNLSIKPERDTSGLMERICLPTGNLNATYMIVGDSPARVAPGKKWTWFTDRLDPATRYFDRAWSRGAYALIVREAMRELHISSQVWYTNLLKLQTPKMRASTKEEVLAHRAYLLREIELIEPEYILCVGNHAHSMFLEHYPNYSQGRVIKLNHPCTYAGVDAQVAGRAMASDLFDLLF